jgi:hypothetical protein
MLLAHVFGLPLEELLTSSPTWMTAGMLLTIVSFVWRHLGR